MLFDLRESVKHTHWCWWCFKPKICPSDGANPPTCSRKPAGLPPDMRKPSLWPGHTSHSPSQKTNKGMIKHTYISNFLWLNVYSILIQHLILHWETRSKPNTQKALQEDMLAVFTQRGWNRKHLMKRLGTQKRQTQRRSCALPPLSSCVFRSKMSRRTMAGILVKVYCLEIASSAVCWYFVSFEKVCLKGLIINLVVRGWRFLGTRKEVIGRQKKKGNKWYTGTFSKVQPIFSKVVLDTSTHLSIFYTGLVLFKVIRSWCVQQSMRGGRWGTPQTNNTYRDNLVSN